MEVTSIVQSNGFEDLSLDDRSDAFDEYIRKRNRLQHTGEMAPLLNGLVWVITNEYEIGE